MVGIVMQVVTESIVSGKKVILRLDIDVPIECKVQSAKCKVKEDFRLRAGLPTLKLCLEHASQVIIIGHIGRPSFADSASVVTSAKGAATKGKPEGKAMKELSVVPIKQWLIDQGLGADIKSGKLKLLENLRFDPREEAGDMGFAKELAGMGEIFISEAFAAYHRAVSTTVLPTLLPSYAGLRFAEEVKILTNIRNHPKKPLVVVMGGIKVKDKLPVINMLAQKADAVLVGGKLVAEIREQQLNLPKNVMVGMLTEDGFDIAQETLQAWQCLINRAAMIVWNGPVGRIEDPNLQFTMYNLQKENLGSTKSTYEIAKMILNSNAEVMIGGGDTIAFLGEMNLLDKFENIGFVSVGGGAMLKFLADGTLPTIEVLQ